MLATDTEKFIQQKVVCQPAAIQSLVATLNLKQRSAYIFLGPTGVGKSDVAKALAEGLFGTEKALIYFNIAEYSNNPEQLINTLKSTRPKIVLLDNIEKAPRILTDALFKIPELTQTIMIMTSNIGSHTIIEAQGKISDAVRKKVLTLLQHSFDAEFLQNLSAIIFFHSLTKEQITEIVKNKITNLCDAYQGKGIEVKISSEVISFLGEKGYDPIFGARMLKPLMETELYAPLEEYAQKHSRIKISLIKEQIIFK